MPTPTSPELQAVRKAGRKLAQINARRDAAIEELRTVLRAADASDPRPTRSQLVEAAGVARQTVYDALKPVEAPTEAQMDAAALRTAPAEGWPA